MGVGEDMLKVGSLFSGIGGIDLACEWAGMEVIWQCEIDPFCQQVLKKHWPEVKLYDDIHEINRSNTIRPDILVGGFPCQPYSIAGQQEGAGDDRDLWPEMFRVISELKPTWVVGENVDHFIHLGLEYALSDLENEGYEIQSFVIPARGVGAVHRRNRLFIVAHSNKKSKLQTNQASFPVRKEQQTRQNITWGNRTSLSSTHWQAYQPRVYRVDDGDAYWMDRNKALGNAVVPQQIYPIMQAIADIERSYIA